MDEVQGFNKDHMQKSAEFIKKNVPFLPKILIICGSGLGTLADTLEDAITLNYEDIPYFPVSTVPGHVGKLVFGTLANVKVVCMQGRFHYYEGYSLQKTTCPIRILESIGTKILIVTNAAGGVNRNYKVGDVMIIKDHVNFLGFSGINPLRGKNDPNVGERFFPMNRAYDKNMNALAMEVAKTVGLEGHVHQGIYAMVGGPNYETIAEINALQAMGVDAVGMSTVPEVLVAKHCGMKVFGFSIITNEGIHSYDDENEPNHKEVLDAVNERVEQLQRFVTKIVAKVEITKA